ncbi:MAG: hypothetical protein RIQ60_1614 [Pseudomonadota bacterium]
MKRSVFLSYPQPFNAAQRDFLAKIKTYLASRLLEPRTLGVTDYDLDSPLKGIRHLMMESNGLITIAFRRTLIVDGVSKPQTDNAKQLEHTWLSSPWPHIEAAMAFQIGLPILILREKGVLADGILEKGVIGSYMPEFDLDSPDDYLDSDEWKEIIQKWEGYVRQVVENKANPPRLYA